MKNKLKISESLSPEHQISTHKDIAMQYPQKYRFACQSQILFVASHIRSMKVAPIVEINQMGWIY